MFPNEFLRNSGIEHLHEYKQLLLDQHVQIVQTICKKVKIMKNIQEISTTTDIQLKVVNYSNKKNDWDLNKVWDAKWDLHPLPFPFRTQSS